MELTRIKAHKYSVVAVMEGDACPALDFLKDQPEKLQGSAKGYKVLFQRYAEHGRNGLTNKLFHEVDGPHEIWEFIKGRLRVFCFIDDGRMVILTHGALKKSQKVSKQEVAAAIRIKARYITAKQQDEIEFMERHDEY